MTDEMWAFFEAEIENEEHGGDRPATLDSAHGSLVQMPVDVLIEMAEADDDTFDRTVFTHEFQALHKEHGPQKRLAELLD